MNGETALTPAAGIAQASPMAGKNLATVTRAGYTSAPKAVKGDTGGVWKNVQSINPLPFTLHLRLSPLQENTVMTDRAITPIPLPKIQKRVEFYVRVCFVSNISHKNFFIEIAVVIITRWSTGFHITYGNQLNIEE